MTTDRSAEDAARSAGPPPPEPESPLEPVPMAPVPPEDRRGRAGRNLPAAIAVGASLAALVPLSVYLAPVLFAGLVGVAVSLALWELRNGLAAGAIRIPVLPLVVGGWAMVVAAYASGPEALLVALVLTVLTTILWRLPENPAGYTRDVTGGVFAVSYVAFLSSFAVLMISQEQGPDRVIVFVLLTVLSDTGGYVAGVLFGKHAMAPRLSPKKSWEGFAGSLLFSVGGGAVALPLLLDAEPWKGAVTGLAVMAVATLGDLAESSIKRDLGIKDMGSLLPGHGGVMDRLDSLLLAAPVSYLLLTWFVPV